MADPPRHEYNNGQPKRQQPRPRVYGEERRRGRCAGIEYSDDAESDGDWEARGFFRTDGVLPQYFIVQLVRYVDGLPSVERVILRGQDSMEVTFQLDGYGQKLQHAVLIVSGATPVTTEVAHFNVQIVPVADE